jgi:hypothetical protein
MNNSGLEWIFSLDQQESKTWPDFKIQSEIADINNDDLLDSTDILPVFFMNYNIGISTMEF